MTKSPFKFIRETKSFPKKWVQYNILKNGVRLGYIYTHGGFNFWILEQTSDSLVATLGLAPCSNLETIKAWVSANL